MTKVDYLVVGSGLTGSTIARCLVEAGREVLVLERRGEVGGNVRDSVHESGVRISDHGPHYFRCSSPRIWEFAKRFASFRPYKPKVLTLVNGSFEDWPIRFQHLQRFPHWRPPALHRPPANFEEACLQKIPPELYRAMVEGYTRKQWGVDPSDLSPNLARRINVNPPNDPSLVPHARYQALPEGGYSAWMESMLAGIPRLCGVDFLQRRDEFGARKLLISTGAVDEYFGFDEGRLRYRGQRRTNAYFQNRDQIQPAVQVNHPNGGSRAPIRTIEWKHLMDPADRPKVKGTVITAEFPYSPTNPDSFEYPFPDSTNDALFRRYRARAQRISNLLICGRLGDYRYYDMDHAIGRALTIARRILEPARASATVSATAGT